MNTEREKRMKHCAGSKTDFSVTRMKALAALALTGLMCLLIPHGVSAQVAQPSRSIEIGEFTQPVEVSLRMGDTLRIVLPSTPSTGYSWHVAGGGTVLKPESSGNTPAAQPRPGAAGRQTLAFSATASGSENLVLDYSRPWEKGKPAARQYAIDVKVGEGSGAPVAIAGSTLLGTYSGKLPCADCSGLLTSISFYAVDSPQSSSGYYVRSSTYLRAPRGNVVSIDAGHLLVQRGTPAKPDWTVYTLQSNTSDHLESYLLQGDTLTPLGDDGKPIQAPFNLSLKRQP